jgi:hypothetical protein
MHGLYIQFWPRLHVLHMPITSVPPKKEKTKTKVRRRAGRQWISLPSLVKEKEVPWVPGTVKLSNTKDKKKMNGDQEGRHTSLLHHTLWSASHLVMHHTSLLHYTSSLHHTLLCITPRYCITPRHCITPCYASHLVIASHLVMHHTSSLHHTLWFASHLVTHHTSLLHHTLWFASHLVMHHTSLLHHTSSLHHTLLCITPRHCITLLLHSHHRCYKAAMPLLFAFSARHFVPRPERYYVGSCLPPLPHVPSILLPFQHRGYKAAILIGVAATASG